MMIEHPKSPLPAKLSGLHLFHDGVATCAQRVRFVLGEKGLERGPDVPWDSDAPATLASTPGSYTSRRVSLRKRQHMSEAYAAIQPNMVVPALVHDGVLHIESVDIVRYLDRTWPTPALIPAEPERRALCDALIERAKGLHGCIRFILFRWALPERAGKLDDAQLKSLRQLEKSDSPEQLGEFYGRYTAGSYSEQIFIEHLRAVEQGFAEIDAMLADGRPWLLGTDFSLADIMWTLKLMRLWEIRYPFARHFPALGAWYERATARRGFREGVWPDTKKMSRVIRAWSGAAHVLGRGVSAHARRPATRPTVLSTTGVAHAAK